jgi:hypothetical protein
MLSQQKLTRGFTARWQVRKVRSLRATNLKSNQTCAIKFMRCIAIIRPYAQSQGKFNDAADLGTASNRRQMLETRRKVRQ